MTTADRRPACAVCGRRWLTSSLARWCCQGAMAIEDDDTPDNAEILVADALRQQEWDREQEELAP